MNIRETIMPSNNSFIFFRNPIGLVLDVASKTNNQEFINVLKSLLMLPFYDSQSTYVYIDIFCWLLGVIYNRY
jgi:hypothetical protein